MNISKTIDKIIELRRHGEASEMRLADYLKETLWGMNAQVEIHPFSYSVQSNAFVGGAVFLFSVLFLVGVLKRWHRTAFLSAFALVLVLVLELSFDVHIVSWPVQKKSETIVVHFPVQDAVRKVIVGTHTGAAPREGFVPPLPGRLEETVLAFLLPMTLVIGLLGLWQLAISFGKLDFEDGRTIMLVMGLVCTIYYVTLFGAWVKEGAAARGVRPDPGSNAGSIAVLAALAEDLSGKYPRLQNTWVTVAFFAGGPDARGARAFAKAPGNRQNQALPTYFIGCEEMGRGGAHGYLAPWDRGINPLYGDRALVRILNRAALSSTGRQLEVIPAATMDMKRFVDFGYPSIVLSTLPPETGFERSGRQGQNRINRGQLLLSLQLIERTLSKFEQPQFR